MTAPEHWRGLCVNPFAPLAWTMAAENPDDEIPAWLHHRIRTTFPSRTLIASRAVHVLRVLASSERPISRQVLAERIGESERNLRRAIGLLEELGAVSVTNRFGIGLGPSVAGPGHLPQHFSDTIGTFARDRLIALRPESDEVFFLAAVTSGDVTVHEWISPSGEPPPSAIDQTVKDHATGLHHHSVSSWNIYARGHRLLVGAARTTGAAVERNVRESGLLLTRALRRRFPSTSESSYTASADRLFG